MKMLLKALSGLLARLLRRPAPNPYGLTCDLTNSQKELREKIDMAVRHGENIIFCMPQRSGATYLAHIAHSEHGGSVVVPNKRAADEFRREHLRMFGKEPDIMLAARAEHGIRGRTGPVLMDACHLYPLDACRIAANTQSAAIGFWGEEKIEVEVYKGAATQEGPWGKATSGYKARLASNHGIWAAGFTPEEVRRAFMLTARSFGMPGDLADYDFVDTDTMF